MKKVFIVTGELSGDKLGAWYAKRLRDERGDVKIHAVGGSFLKDAGATLYERFEVLNIVGLAQIVKRIRFLLKFLSDLAHYIVSQSFDEVIVVDFPGFNLRLIKKLKQLNPEIKITYLSPPQVWIWGAGRVKTIKDYCDDVIVLYPFEVDWYKRRDVQARWLGYPFYEGFKKYFDQEKKQHLAIMPGSRLIEIKRLLPLFIKIARRLKLAYPNTKIVLPLAESIDRTVVEKILRRSVTARWCQDVVIVQGHAAKLEALSTCCLALTKPGTVTLELALLGVPAVVAYKASWVTYLIARLLVSIKNMSLPSLLLNDSVYPEFIQGDCREKKIWRAVRESYQLFLHDKHGYEKKCKKIKRVRDILTR
ncbi:lipid-A-disaccharide synthase [Candidatus Dependentiae bacterium]|nr:lipid-A-disaccharide synthase [Candidatus Dependentiae bacterium]